MFSVLPLAPLVQIEKGFENASSVFLLKLNLPSSFAFVCVCQVPPHVISPSGQPPHQTSLQAVPRRQPTG